jgi:ComEC/Rec2-related protein
VVFACILASAAIAGSSAAAFGILNGKTGKKSFVRSGSFPLAFLVLCAALGLFAGVLVNRHDRIYQDSAYFGFAADKLVRFEAVVQSDSRPAKNGRVLASLRIERVWDASGNSAAASAGALAFFGSDPPAAAGAVQPPRSFQGEKLILDGRLAVDTGGIFLFVREARPGADPPALFSFRKNLLIKIEMRITAFQNRPFRAEWPGLFIALLLGNQEYLDTRLAERFKDAGAVHILALSGMHLGLLALLARLCLKPLAPGRAGDCLILFLIFAYVWLAGPRPSLMRAALMFTAYTILALFDRRPGLLVILAFSFIVSAIFFPQDLQSLSFILSYLAMLGILLFTKPLSRLIRKWIPETLALPLSVSLAAQAAVSPVLLAVFGILSPGGIPSSIALGPLITAFMWTGILACICSNLPPPLSHPFVWISGFSMNCLYAVIKLVVELCARIPPFSF